MIHNRQCTHRQSESVPPSRIVGMSDRWLSDANRKVSHSSESQPPRGSVRVVSNPEVVSGRDGSDWQRKIGLSQAVLVFHRGA
jgi:hypothetical protein